MPEEHYEVHQITLRQAAEAKGVLDSWVVRKETSGVPAPCETSPRTIPTPPPPYDNHGGMSPQDLMMLEDQQRGLFDPLGGVRELARSLKDNIEGAAQIITEPSPYGLKSLSRDPFANNAVPGIDTNAGYNVEKRKPGRPKKKDFLI